MKVRIILAIALFTLPFYSFKVLNERSGSTGNIHVVVEGVGDIKGQIGILLFNVKEGFPTDNDKALKQVLIPLNDKKLSYTFRDISYGRYAVSIMHDENMNDKLDSNLFGIPKEGIGVSNNAKGMLSAPKFVDASFMLEAPDFTTTIELSY